MNCSVGSGVEAHVRIASRVTADRFGQKTIAPGDRMLVDPATGECMPATDANVEAFVRSGMSFYLNPDEEMRASLSAMCGRMLDFGTALGTNVADLKGKAIPGFNLPWWVALWPFSLEFRKVREIKVRESEFIAYLEKKGVIPPSGDVRGDVRQSICDANLFRVYELRGRFGITFHVYTIFVTRVGVEERDGVRRLAVKPSDAGTYNAVMDFVKDRKRRFRRANCRCVSIGSFGGWDGSLNVVELPDSIQLLSSPNHGGSRPWNVRLPNLTHMRPIYRMLVYRLWPELWTDWHKEICRALENDSVDGSMTVSRMSDNTGIPKDCVAEVFERLRTDKSRKWRSRRTAKGKLAIESRAPGIAANAGAFVPSARKWPFVLLDWFLILLAFALSFYGNNCFKGAFGKSDDVSTAVSCADTTSNSVAVVSCVTNNLTGQIPASSDSGQPGKSKGGVAWSRIIGVMGCVIGLGIVNMCKGHVERKIHE